VTGGRSTTIPDVVAVHVTGTSEGTAIDQTFHLQQVGGHYHYFVDCGTPL